MCDHCGHEVGPEDCSPENCESCEMAVICDVKEELWQIAEKYGVDPYEMLMATQGMFVDMACFALEEEDEIAFKIHDANVQAISRVLDEVDMNYETVGVPSGAIN